MAVPPLLDELLRANAPSGSEDAVMAIVRREAGAFAEVAYDVHGNTTARVAGAAGGRTLALLGHADEIGLVVTHVLEDGLAAVAKLTNLPAKAIAGRRVVVLGRGGPVPGVVVRPSKGDGDPEWSNLRLDVGAPDAETALALVEPGDPAVMAGEPVELAGGRLMSKSLDNRVGVYAALETLRRLAAEPPAVDVVLVVTALEETGAAIDGGAAVAAQALAADVAVVFEVTYSADAPGADPGEWGDSKLGGGPTIFRGPTIHPAVFAGLRAAAEEASIPYSLESGASTWSDSEAVQAAGTPVGLVSIPLRYMHTPNEVVQLSDVEAAGRLVEAYARSLAPDVSFLR